MPTRIVQLVTMAAALAAFAPVLAVDFLLDGYVGVREGAKLQNAVEQVTRETQSSVNSAIASLRHVVAVSPTLCSPTFLNTVHDEMQDSLVLRQVVVANADGVQLCDAFGRDFDYRAVSATIPVPGHDETITVVNLPGHDLPSLKITAPAAGNREISAFVPVNPHIVFGLPRPLENATMLRMSLTNGTEIATFGDPTRFDSATDKSKFISAESIAGEIPLRTQAAIPFALVRTGYADLDIGFTVVACIMSAAFLWLSLQYVRRANNPTFDLERAIAAGQLKPRYQPVVNLMTGQIAGCEVLIRWEKRSGEVVSPGAFIEYAEMSGLAIPMTLSLMEQVRHDLEPLCREQPHLKVSFNLFERHFRDGTIVEDVISIFEGSSLTYEQLVFEITERQPLEDKDDADATITALHRLGCRVALDDAGTGHSNLAYLHQLGIDIIKIDKVFMDLVKRRTDSVPVLDALIHMARNLNTDVIAEGVETEEQALYLRAKGVPFAQGYLFAVPLLPGPFIELTRRMNGGRAMHDDEELGAAHAA